MTKGAIFSEDRKHRYVLIRIWDETKPMMMFIGLNPSKADEKDNDNTITKVEKIAKYNGFGGCYMTNLFSYVSTDSTNQEICVDIIKIAIKRSEEVIKMFPDAYCIKKSKKGMPIHPLYQLDKSELIPFKNKL